MVGGAPLPGGRREPLLGSLRAELRALARGDAAPAAPAAPGGTEPLLVAEELFPSAAFPAELFGPGFRWEGGEGPVLLDLETCGLADDPIFLLGVLRPEEAGLRLLHVLARDPSGEPALLRRAGELLPAEAPWVSFTGSRSARPRSTRTSSTSCGAAGRDSCPTAGSSRSRGGSSGSRGGRTTSRGGRCPSATATT